MTDGTTYDFTVTNGEDIGAREEITQLKEDLTESVGDLKSAFDSLAEATATATEEEEEQVTNIYPFITWTSGYMAKNGSTYSAESLHYSQKIPVNEGDRVYYSLSDYMFRFITAFSDNTAIEAKGAESVTSYTVPSGVNYIVITDYLTKGDEPINYAVLVTVYKNIYEDVIDAYEEADLPNRVTELESDVDDLNNIAEATTKQVVFEKTNNIESSLTYTSGYMAANGATGSATTLHYSNKISVTKGDILTPGSGSFRFVTAYDGDTVITAS
jgi:hypothetical protein